MIITKQNDLPGKGRILVVDDDYDIRELLESFVESIGFDCVKASDGLEAMEILAKQSFAIVITDMIMPEVGGMELLGHIKTHYPGTSVLVVTGYAGTFSYVDVIQAGASDFIVKPFNFDELEAKLKRILREQEMLSGLEFLSNCDALTGLFNRRYMDKKVNEEVHRADRQGYSVFLMMLDVDYFKSYNDEYGHPAGDKLLIKIASILQNCTRADVDLVCRHGGDEFAIITPYISSEQVELIGKRIIALFQEQSFGDTGLSLGVAEFVRGDGSFVEDISSLFRRADQALYQAKKQGRNQLVFSA